MSFWLKVAPPNFFKSLKIHSNGTWAFLRLRFRNNLGFFFGSIRNKFSIRETGHRRVCQKLGRFRFSEIAASMKSRWWSNEKLEKFGYRDQFFKQPKFRPGRKILGHPKNSGQGLPEPKTEFLKKQFCHNWDKTFLRLARTKSYNLVSLSFWNFTTDISPDVTFVILEIQCCIWGVSQEVGNLEFLKR